MISGNGILATFVLPLPPKTSITFQNSKQNHLSSSSPSRRLQRHRKYFVAVNDGRERRVAETKGAWKWAVFFLTPTSFSTLRRHGQFLHRWVPSFSGYLPINAAADVRSSSIGTIENNEPADQYDCESEERIEAVVEEALAERARPTRNSKRSRSS
nr:transcription factor SPATULA [Ipomoea batatas]